MTDWIEWKGGECPVGKRVQVNVKFRGDGPGDSAWDHPETAGSLRWDHRKANGYAGDGDIIAYRVVKE